MWDLQRLLSVLILGVRVLGFRTCFVSKRSDVEGFLDRFGIGARKKARQAVDYVGASRPILVTIMAATAAIRIEKVLVVVDMHRHRTCTERIRATVTPQAKSASPWTRKKMEVTCSEGQIARTLKTS